MSSVRALPARLAVLLALALGAAPLPAAAAEPRFQSVALLAALDRVSLVFELTGEPQNVATRRVSAAVLELDAGPVVAPARATSFMAPPGVRFVMGVSIKAGDGTVGRLRARITLLERARSTVRVVGHRVYVDFAPDQPPPARMLDRRGLAAAAAPSSPPPAAAATAPPPAPPAVPVYSATVGPAIERFEQLGPYLLSAAASPSEPVLKAVGSTLVGIQGLLLSVDVPEESRAVHELLASAVATAVGAVAPAFAGDRAAQARQALTRLEQVRASWPPPGGTE